MMSNILEGIFDEVLSGDVERTEGSVNAALSEGIPPEDILRKSLIASMREVGRRFEAGDLFVPEMLISARAMKSGLIILRPHLVESGVEMIGTVLIGTVKGDLHDIGKNLVAMMLEGAGFEIIDLGTDVSPQDFAAETRKHKPDFIGMSALLTTTMPEMRNTIEALEDLGIRDEVRIIVGGAPITEDFATEIGADGFAADASRAVSLARRLI